MRLQIFATHVAAICLAKAFDTFTLSPCEGVRVEVEIGGNDQTYINDKWTGNRQGGVAEYARIVAELVTIPQLLG